MALTPQLRCESFSLHDFTFLFQYPVVAVHTFTLSRSSGSGNTVPREEARSARQECQSSSSVSITDPFLTDRHNAPLQRAHTMNCPAKRSNKSALGLQLRVPHLAWAPRTGQSPSAPYEGP